MSTYTIQLSGGTDNETATLVTEEQVDGLCHVILHYRDRAVQASASDFFEALCLLRVQLEPQHLIPLCYGASLNVYPSGMTRDMGDGLFAYKLTPGRQALRADLVGIFDVGPDVVPSSVADQERYFDAWLQSLKA